MNKYIKFAVGGVAAVLVSDFVTDRFAKDASGTMRDVYRYGGAALGVGLALTFLPSVT